MESESFLDILSYLPIYFRTEPDNLYFNKLVEGVMFNFDKENYNLSALCLHKIFMIFYYKLLWLIYVYENDKFEYALIGFGSRTIEEFNKFEKSVLNRDISQEIKKFESEEEKNERLSNKLPFAFSTINERTIFDLVKLITDDLDLIRDSKEKVDQRNQIAHANGKNAFENKGFFLEYIESYQELFYLYFQVYAKLLNLCFEYFLRNFDFDLIEEYSNIDREDKEQIREYNQTIKEIFEESLVRKNYLSRKDLNFLCSFEIEDLKTEEDYDKFRRVFELFKNNYS